MIRGLIDNALMAADWGRPSCELAVACMGAANRYPFFAILN